MQDLFDSAEAVGKDKTKTNAIAKNSKRIENSNYTAGKALDEAAETTVAAALARSRTVCKMGYAVGAAPIMYGLPARMTA